MLLQQQQEHRAEGRQEGGKHQQERGGAERAVAEGFAKVVADHQESAGVTQKAAQERLKVGEVREAREDRREIRQEHQQPDRK